MDLASLPPRPLSLEECRDLEASDQFRSLVPAGVFDLAESDRRLMPALVFVTETTVVAAGYVLAADAEPSEEGGDTAADVGAGGWTVVAEYDAPSEKAALEDRVREAGEELREWARGQSWPDDPSSLLEAL
jgi:hypothetical protein